MSGGHVVVLTGGVGGAKLVAGLVDAIGGDRVTAIVNTGDDFVHLGLSISPDIDTLLYTLAGLADPVRGWGRRDESWAMHETIGAMGGPDWFLLGDRDLALHLTRSEALRQGESLSSITASLAARMGIDAEIVPMSDEPCGVVIDSDEGRLEFQRYFVGRRAEPVVRSVDLSAAKAARMAEAARAALARDDLDAVLIAPSNPWLSVDPILAVPGMRAAIAAADAPVVAVTPLPGGQAVKGPTAKIMRELGLRLDVQSIADHYAGLIDGLLIDERDASDPAGVPSVRADTIMVDAETRMRVARAALDFAGRL